MLEIRTFGGLSITQIDRPAPAFATRKVEALLVYLACTGRRSPRDLLAELLWNDRSEEQSRSNLRVVLSRLNQQFPGLLQSDRHEIGLTPGAVRLDVAVLEAGLAPLLGPDPTGADRRAAEAALALYAGDFLAGYALRDSRGFDDWLLLERERLRQRVVGALDRLAGLCLQQGDWSAGLGHARRLLTLDELREESHRQVMRLLAAAGEPAAALAQYETCRQTLERELGVTPSAPTAALRQQIAAGAPTGAAETAPRPRPRLINPLPQDVGSRYIGNAGRLAEVTAALRGDARLISLIGRGGIGKTALACKALSEIMESGDQPINGVVALSALSTGLSLNRLLADAGRLLEPMASSLLDAVTRDPQAAAGQKIGVLLEQLRGGRYVFLLDNLETLQDPQTGEISDPDLRLFVETSLAQSSAVCLLITSREHLPLPRPLLTWERQVALEAGLPDAEAAALLRRFDPAGTAGLRDAPDDLLLKLTRSVHGFPRGLEALAGLLLEDPLLRPEALLQDGVLLAKEVEVAVVRQVIDRLPRELGWVLEALALFNAPVPPAALDYVLAPGPVSGSPRHLINRLIRSRFIAFNPGTGLLELHPIDQQYCYDRIPEGDDLVYSRRAWHHRAAGYFAAQSRPEADWSTPADLAPQLAEFHHRLRAGETDAAARILLGIDRDHLWEWGERRRLLSLYAELAAAGGPADSGLARSSRRRSAWLNWPDMQTVVPAFEANLVEARAAGDERAEAGALDDLAQSLRFRLDMPGALEMHEQALALCRKIGDRRGEGDALGGVGSCHLWFGRTEAGLACAAQALAIHRDLGHLPSAGYALWLMGGLYRMAGRFDQAAVSYQQAVETYAQINGQLGVVRNLLELSWTYSEAGPGELAEAKARQALSLAQALNWREGEVQALAYLGRAQLVSGRPAAALESLRAAGQAGGAGRTAALGPTLGKMLLLQALILNGDFEAARRLDAGLPALPPNPLITFHSQAWRGVLQARLGERDQACALFEGIIRESEPWLDNPGGFRVRYSRGLAHAGLALVSDDYPLEPAIADFVEALRQTAAPGLVAVQQQALGVLMACPGGERLLPVRKILNEA